jgi:hypothetical protein
MRRGIPVGHNGCRCELRETEIMVWTAFGVTPLVGIVGALIALLLPGFARASATVVISEYGGCQMTSGSSSCAGPTVSNDEFVELYNATNSTLDISGWFIQRRNASGVVTCWASLPPGQSIAPHGYYLVGGAGFNASNYANAPNVDLNTGATGTTITGGSESLVLISAAGTCTGSVASAVIDSVSFGSITDTFSALRLPPIPGVSLGNGRSAERKACADSTSDQTTTGMLASGGEALQGNAFSSGASILDWIVRPSAEPQSSAATAEIPGASCVVAPAPVPSLAWSQLCVLAMLLVGSAALRSPAFGSKVTPGGPWDQSRP